MKKPGIALKQNMDALSNQYSLIAEDYEGITYNDKKMGWEQLAKDFVYTQ